MIFGKTLVITGVASGIGHRAAHLAQSLGANVIGIDVNAPDQIVGQFIQADISTADGVADLAASIPHGIDGLCNVAGLSGKAGVEKTLAVNVYGLRALTEALAPKIREGGAVVNVASMAGFGWRENLDRAKAMLDAPGFPDLTALAQAHGIVGPEVYPISKELLLVWTLRAAHQPLFKDRNIRVNAVSPGPVETPILKQFRSVLGDERVNGDIARVGRAGHAEDIAPVILFLCSDAARWVNGVNLPTDGGLDASVTAETLGF